MTYVQLLDSFLKLKNYCEKENFKGWDVSDSSGSKLITHTPLGKIPFFRFAIAQLTGHRIAYINVRPLLFIPKHYNSKGIALFLNGYCNLHDIISHGGDVGISKVECLDKIKYLAKLLISLKREGFSGAGWGYPIGWQQRLSKYFPPNSPTVVVTSFAVEALFHTYEITKDSYYKNIALTSAEFVLKDLHRTPYKNGFFLSYSPYEGLDTVYNASLLGARLLSQCYLYSGIKEYIEIAKKCIFTCIECQADDGSWVYGRGSTQGWIDNFHTGYNLDAIQTYQDISKDYTFKNNIDKGLDFMLKNHFEKDYTPKYYHNKRYPIDIHCCGEIFVVFHKLKAFDNNKELAEGVLNWTINNMQDKSKGYFYFQKWSRITNKTPLMRWSQSFMFNALSYYLKSENCVE